MSSILVASDHPSLTVGFATVAAGVATALAGRGWAVHRLGVGCESGSEVGAGPDVEAVRDVDHLAARVAELARGDQVLLFFGRSDDVIALDRELSARRARRRVQIVYYAAVDHTPAPPEVSQLTDAVDWIVPATEFGREALASVPTTSPIPHGVDIDRFRPLDRHRRAQVRAREFGARDQLVVGYFGRNSNHKRPDMALRAFAHVATGSYAVCRDCSRITASELGADGRPGPIGACRRCGAALTGWSRGDRDVMLYMHTELVDERTRRACGGFDLELLAERLGVADRVIFDPTVDVGDGVPIAVLAERMAAVDVHVLLGVGGGWELTVLETGACGVPNVVTDYAGPGEYARPFAELIPVAGAVFQPWGLECLADLDVAVERLLALAASRDRRAVLGEAGPPTAARYSWGHVGASWHDLLEEIA